MSKLERVTAFTQIEPVVKNYGVRNVLLVYALDASGALWVRQADDPAVGEWTRVEQPPRSSALAYSQTTRGRKSNG